MYTGSLDKMNSILENPVKYSFVVGDQCIDLNDFIGLKISIDWLGNVSCVCGKSLNKFYRQNFCYQCFWNSPLASQSIFKPELCTADLGIEERDLDWEKKFQIAPHYVYLANSSGLKVGITRKTQKITRWIDQGASQAILFAEVPNRRLSGIIEVELKKHLADKTNWRRMLSGEPEKIDLLEKKNEYSEKIPSELRRFLHLDDEVTNINYPVKIFPDKVKSLSLSKVKKIEGKLTGIKGQYLLFENDCVFNVRSHKGYNVKISF